MPSSFSGNSLYPSSFGCTLRILFSQPLTDLSLSFFSGELSGEYDTASLLRMTAYVDSEANPPLASDGYRFAHWEEAGLIIGTATTFDLVLEADRGLTAVFTPILAVTYDPLADPATVDLSWPWPSEGYLLHEKVAPQAGIRVEAGLPVDVANDRSHAHAPVTEGPRFFRLFHPLIP